MTIACVADLVEMLRQGRLLDEGQHQELAALQPRFPEPRALARELIRRNWLTAYQVNQLFLGRAADLVLGQYVLLERLGEGGMGQVFKARHRGLDRVVALKVVRKDCLDNPNVLARFQREIQAAAQLDHPNVVRAFDADQAGPTWFFAMEYIEGTDLAQLIKQSGPLPVLQACDYVRQAALGLQHAHERGLVHRDIKPHNLLVARPEAPAARGSSAHLSRPFACAYRWGVLKILDMGLARLLDRDERPASTMLTQIGSVMGTPDFIAPEQARNSHTSDIRADLYSLGCTLYYLLSGQAPFPNGTITEKLLQHQLDDPEPVEKVRRARLLEDSSAHLTGQDACSNLGVPAEVRAVLGRLLMKSPENRYQTPAELADVLAEVAADLETKRPRRPRLAPSDPTIVAEPPPSDRFRLAPSAARPVPSSADAVTAGPPRRAPRTQRVQRPDLFRRRWLGSQTRGRLIVCSMLLLAVLSGRAVEQGRQPVPPSPPPRPAEAEAAWAALLARVHGAQVDRDKLRKELVAFRAAHPGLPYAPRMADVLARLPSPLDSLQASGIPKTERQRWFPPALVGVLGEGRPFQSVPALCVAFSPDGDQVARGGADALVRRWECASLRELPRLPQHSGRVLSLTYSPDGRVLASGSQDGAVVLWDAATGEVRKSWQAHAYPVVGLAFAPDGNTVATGSWDGTAKLWDAKKGSLLLTLPGRPEDRLLSLSYVPGGRAVACGYEDHIVRLWDVRPASSKPRAVYHGHTSWVTVVAFSPDGRTLVSGGGGDGTLRLCEWDGTAFKEGKVLDGHEDVVHDVAFSPDGKTLASASADRTVKLWQVATGRRLDDLSLRAAVHGVAFAPDGRHLAAANANGTVYLLRLAGPPPRDALAQAAPGAVRLP